MSIVTKVLAAIMVHYPSRICTSNVRAHQLEFRLRRGCIDKIFTFCQLFQTRQTPLPGNRGSFDLEASFISVNRTKRFSVVHWDGMSGKHRAGVLLVA